MAKPKGGLGRGLSSLLGVMDGTISQTPASPAPENVDAAAKESAAKEPASSPVDEKTKETAPTEPPKSKGPKQDPIVIPEDNSIIKEVIEREVDTSIAAEEERKADDEVDIDLIIPNPYQPRTNFKKEELDELAESIKKNGLLSPILVRPYDGKYQIIAGERRWQACKLINMKKVPIRIKEADDDQSIILALVENIQRSNLNPIEEAYGYRRMMERGKMTQSEVAQAVSKGRTTITNALRLLELPEEAQQLLFEDKITAGHARAILSIPTKEGRRKLIDKLIEEKLSVRDAERIAKLLSGKQKQKPVERQAAPKSYKTVARALSDSLETDVKIKSTKGSNQIQIFFKDEADLQRLFRIIANS
ncbi:MAG: ParB/RepB/Spo0J family partition protein [Oxalobacter sp.]|nr:ParB/RepB/Spo0J family partition protein [Oxalobacter sp.]